jgi:hypothetical protein
MRGGRTDGRADVFCIWECAKNVTLKKILHIKFIVSANIKEAAFARFQWRSTSVLPEEA